MSKFYPDTIIIAVMPAYNAEKTLSRTVADVDPDWIDEIVLVDDHSRDNTVDKARELGLAHVFVHDQNKGYGGNQKTCYQEALRLGADIVVMIHPDHQYDPKYIPEMVLPIIRKDAQAVFGSRMMIPGGALKGGMPYWKYLANIFLTRMENLVLRLRLTEYHSGLRAYEAKTLRELPLSYNSDNFVFDTEIIVQLKVFGKTIQEIPIHTRYFPEASGVGFWRGVEYGWHILMVMRDYLFFRLGLKKDARFMSQVS